MKENLNFSDKVYSLVSKVPKGKVVTYGQIAKKLSSKAYRAVGTAMNKNPYADAKGEIKVCCHRVINSDGKIGGFASGTKNKIKMLKAEGIEIINGKINLKKFSYKFK